MSGIDEFGFPIAGGFPTIDAAGMTEVDLVIVHSYGITSPQKMENAARGLAPVARRRFLLGDKKAQ